MAIQFSCPKCGKTYVQPEAAAGKQARCTCGQQITVPTPPAAARPAPIPPAPLDPLADMLGTPPQSGYGSPGQQFGGHGNQPAYGYPMQGAPRSGNNRKWLLPTAIIGGVSLIGVVVLIVVLASGGTDEPDPGTNVAANGAAGQPPAANSGLPNSPQQNQGTPGRGGQSAIGQGSGAQNSGGQQPSNATGPKPGDDNDFTRGLPSPNWGNEPLESAPPLDEDLKSKLSWLAAEHDYKLLSDALADPNPRARKEATETLSTLNVAPNLDEYRDVILQRSIENLSHPTPEVRTAAAYLLATYGPEARPALMPLAVLLKAAHTDDEATGAAMALRAMGEAARPAIPLLVQAPFKNENNLQCISACTEALGRLNCVAELSYLQKSNLTYASNSALESAGWLNPVPEDVLQNLIRMAESGELFSGATMGVAALSHVRPTTPRIMQALNVAMDSDDRFVRAEVADALATIDPATPGYQELLQRALNDPESIVHNSGTAALTRNDGDAATRLVTLLEQYAKDKKNLDTNFELDYLDQTEIETFTKLIDGTIETTLQNRCYAARFLGKNVEIYSLRTKPEQLAESDYASLLATVEAQINDASLPSAVRGCLLVGREDPLDADSIPPLILETMLGDGPLGAREEAAEWISEQVIWNDDKDPAVIGSLIKALGQAEGAVPSFAGKALGFFEDGSTMVALPAIRKVAQNTKVTQRALLVDALTMLKDPSNEALDLLLKLLESDPDPKVQHSAAIALGQLSKEHPIRATQILAALRARFRMADNPLRHGIVQGYGAIGADAAAAVPEMVELLNRRELRLREVLLLSDEDDLLEKTVGALGEIDQRADIAVPALARVLDDEHLRRSALKALTQYGGDAGAAVPQLLKLLDKESPGYRHVQQACELLAAIGSPQTAPAIARLREMCQPDGGVYGLQRISAGAALYAASQEPQDRELAINRLFEQSLEDQKTTLRLLRSTLAKQSQEILNAALASNDQQIRTNATEVQVALSQPEDTNEENAGRKNEIAGDLASSEARSRLAAVNALLKHGAIRDKETELLGLLEDEDARVREAAGKALARLGGHGPRVVEVLAGDLLQQANQGQYFGWSQTLDQYHQTTALWLWNKLRDRTSDDATRASAAKILISGGRVPDVSMAEVQTALGSDNAHVKLAAAWVAALQVPFDAVETDPRLTLVDPAIDILIATVQQPSDSELFAGAAGALSHLGPLAAKALPPLWTAWRQNKNSGELTDAVGSIGLDAARWRELVSIMTASKEECLAASSLIVYMGEHDEQMPDDVSASLAQFLKHSVVADFNNDDDLYLDFVTGLGRTGEVGRTLLLVLACDGTAPPPARRMGLEGLFVLFFEEGKTTFSEPQQKLMMDLTISRDPILQFNAAVFALNFRPDDATLQGIVENGLSQLDDGKMGRRLSGHVADMDYAAGNPRLRQLLAGRARARVTGGADDRFAAANDLVRFSKSVQDLDLILQLLPAADEDYDRYELRAAVAQFGDTAVASLRKALNTGDPPTRVFAARVITDLGEKAKPAIKELRDRLKSTDGHSQQGWEERAHYALALASCDPKSAEARTALLELFQADYATDHSLTREIMIAIRDSGGATESTIPRFIELLDSDLNRDPTLQLLGSLGPALAPAVPRLIEMLDDEYPRTAIGALRDLGTAAQPALPALRNLLNDEPKLRDAAEAYAKIAQGAERGEAVTQLLAQFDDPVLAENSIRGISHFGADAQPAFARIKQLTTGANIPHAEAAIAAIGTLHAEFPEAITLLTLALDNPQFQSVALSALAKCGPDARPAVPKLIELINVEKGKQFPSRLIMTLQQMGPAAKDAIPALQQLRVRFGLKSRNAQAVDEVIATLRGTRAIPHE